MLIQKINKILSLILFLYATAAAAAQTVTYFHNDVAGTPLLATDGNGSIVWKENYYPYGERFNRDANSNNKLWFTGKPYDNDTGLTYLGARYYNPLLGRFMGVDPKGFDPENIHSFNRYAYANSNPYRYVDPDGHTPLDLAFLAYDIGKVAVAMYSGQGIAMAWADVAMSALGVVSPIPGTGQALKVVRAEQRWAEVASAGHKASNVTKGTAEKIFQAGRTGSGLKEDVSHRAASFLSKEQLQAGSVFPLRGGDGIERTLLQKKGELNGKKGIYEYILDPSAKVSHQRFIENGIINGIPNQKVPKIP